MRKIFWESQHFKWFGISKSRKIRTSASEKMEKRVGRGGGGHMFLMKGDLWMGEMYILKNFAVTKYKGIDYLGQIPWFSGFRGHVVAVFHSFKVSLSWWLDIRDYLKRQTGWMGNFTGAIVLSVDGNQKRSDFDNSNLFQS